MTGFRASGDLSVMDLKMDALLLRAVDYGENDRMVTLLTAERGKIGAAMKGVRKAGAKLRFASQPFCFAEYVLAEKGGRNTVTQASLHDGFYDLRTNVGAYYAAACVTEVCDLFAMENMAAGPLLVCAVTALGEIEQNLAAPDPALVKFLAEAVMLAGYPLSAGDCPVCGKKLSGRRYFDLQTGAFNCSDCAVGVPASPSTYDAIRSALYSIDKTFPGGEGAHAEADGYRRALRLLRAYIAYQTDAALPALSQYVAL